MTTIKYSKIKQIMKKKGITLEMMGVMMGLKSRQAASYRIKNAKTFRTVEAIAKALKVKRNDII